MGFFEKEPKEESLLRSLRAVSDPRSHNTRHRLDHVLAILLTCLAAGADTFEQVEEMARAKAAYLKRLFGIVRIPSHDTLARIFAMIDVAQLEFAVREWTLAHIDDVGDGAVISLDGKNLRNGEAEEHVVSAWSSAHGVSLGSVTTGGAKRNEHAAFIRLIGQLRLQGAIVTIDAAGTHADVAAAIRAKGADYVLPVKGNQKLTAEDVELAFAKPFAPVGKTTDVTKHGGRVEERTCELMPVAAGQLPHCDKWPDLRAIARVTTTVTGGTDGKERSSVRHFISSATKVEDVARAVRSHWGVENGLHWHLDVIFREDDCRVRLKDLAKNLNTLRRWVLNTLKRAFPGASLAKQRRLAGWSDDHFVRVAKLFAQDSSY